MAAIGVWSFKMVRVSADFFVAGGKLPGGCRGLRTMSPIRRGGLYRLCAIAYSHGFTIYMWWAVAITLSVVLGAHWIAPRWALRRKLNIESPLENLSTR
jgi:solute:Na+ symporter, SSS family